MNVDGKMKGKNVGETKGSDMKETDIHTSAARNKERSKETKET